MTEGYLIADSCLSSNNEPFFVHGNIRNPEMKQENFDSWEQFETQLQQLQDVRAETVAAKGGGVSHFLFRGHGDYSWRLETTLERTKIKPWSLSKYFRFVSIARPQIETFTKLRWEIEDWPKLRDWASKYDNLKLSQFPAYDYLVFLRHHGFPSPLLDWTRSPYVAAFFAFAQPRSERVAMYLYQEYSGQGKVGSSNLPQIVSFGPYVRSHSRHFLQQSEYTIAAQFRDGEWWYVPHEDVFATSSNTQDRLWKVTMPATERLKVLKILDAHNLNAFSLFQTEEALLSTIAVRELELSEKGL